MNLELKRMEARYVSTGKTTIAQGKFLKARFLAPKDLEEEEGTTNNYFIEIDDLLEISVWQIEELQREVVVRPDGKISFPLIGDMPAAGRTIEELRQDITEKIKVYIKSPQVSVTIKEFGGKKAVVLGEVQNPGVIRFSAPIRFIEAIGLAGDFGQEANTDKVFVIRGAYTEQPSIILVNVTDILRKGNLRENILVHSDDIVYVPRSLINDVKFFMNNMFAPIVGYTESYYGSTWRRRQPSGKWLHDPRGTRSVSY